MAHDVRGHGRDILGDQPGIEPIVLGEGAASAGELPKSVGIDATHRQAGGEQGAEDAALVAAARLEPNGGEEQSGDRPITSLNEGNRAFLDELARLGYVEGETIRIDRWTAGGRPERFAPLAEDVARL